MARRIDQIILWLSVLLSAFFLMLVLTDGNILLSMLCAFAIALILRILIQKFIPEKKWISRKKQIRQIENFLYQCALMDESSALNTICDLLPNLFFDVDPSDVVPILRLPHDSVFSCAELLDLWHRLKHDFPTKDHMLIFMTCSLAEDAENLLSLLTSPQLQIVDKNKLIRQLMKEMHRLPEKSISSKKREPRRSLCDRATLLFENIHPLHASMYLCFFIVMYLISRSAIHLLSAAACAALLLIYMLTYRRRYMR